MSQAAALNIWPLLKLGDICGRLSIDNGDIVESGEDDVEASDDGNDRQEPGSRNVVPGEDVRDLLSAAPLEC